jgi:GATA-binding protein
MDRRGFSNVGPSMTYATSSPSATSAGQGNSPVSPTPHLPVFPSSPYRLGFARKFSTSAIPYRPSASIMSTIANHDRDASQPVCQNCTTSTTPLWRRDEIGSVLCNACGLFLKLHGKPRPISLKTDVIKSRNRVKSAGQGAKKKVRAMRWR